MFLGINVWEDILFMEQRTSFFDRLTCSTSGRALIAGLAIAGSIAGVMNNMLTEEPVIYTREQTSTATVYTREHRVIDPTGYYGRKMDTSGNFNNDALVMKSTLTIPKNEGENAQLENTAVRENRFLGITYARQQEYSNKNSDNKYNMVPTFIPKLGADAHQFKQSNHLYGDKAAADAYTAVFNKEARQYAASINAMMASAGKDTVQREQAVYEYGRPSMEVERINGIQAAKNNAETWMLSNPGAVILGFCALGLAFRYAAVEDKTTKGADVSKKRASPPPKPAI